MARVTDVVFIYPDGGDNEVGRCERFEELVTLHTGRTPTPLRDTGIKAAWSAMYFLGVNYLLSDLEDALLSEPWPRGTVLYLRNEGEDVPSVTVFGETR